MLDSIEKISEITQTNIPLLKIHKEKFSIISKENILSLSESDSFRLIEKSSSIEKSDKSEKPKNIKIKNLENKKKIKKLEGIITPRRISPEKRNIILTPSLSEINFEIVNKNNKEIKESNVSEMTQTEEDIEEKYEKDILLEIEQNEQFNISNKEIPKDINEEIIKEKNIKMRYEVGKKIKEKDLVIYQNNEFTFEILQTKEDDKIIINKPDYDIENQFFEIQNIKDKNISFKDSISSESPNKIYLFQENKTIFSSNDKFSLLKEDKKHEEKILIEKPESYKNKFDLSLIRPQNINLDNLLIIPKEKEHKVLKEKTKDNNVLSISSLSINLVDKDLTISKEESKDITKDITKDISKEISIKKSENIDNDIVNYNDGNSIFNKLTQIKEINVLESIPSFRDTSYNKDSTFKDLSLNKDNSIRDFSIKKEISFIKENENEDEKSKSELKQENSELGYSLDEPVKIPIQSSQELKDNTFDLKENSRIFENENELAISKKFNKLILSDYSQKNLIDTPLDRNSFIPHINDNIIENENKNNNIITHYFFELTKEGIDFEDENDLIKLPEINIYDDEHKLTDSVFTHNFFKKDKSHLMKEKDLLLKKILPIKTIEVIKEKNNKSVLMI